MFGNLYYKDDANVKNTIEGSWNYSIKNMLFQNENLGRDVFYTYGPLATYFFSSPALTDSFLILILPVLLSVFLALIIYFLLFKLTRFKVRSLLFLPPLFLLFHAISAIKLEFCIQFILLLIIFNVDRKKITLNKKTILILAFFTAFATLLKFSLGMVSVATLSFLIFLNNKKIISKQNIKKIIFYESLVFVFLFILFYFSAKSTDIITYLSNSLQVSIGYKEYMAVDVQLPVVKFINFLLIFPILLNLFILKKKNYPSYLILSYFAILYGFVRNDLHVLTSLQYMFTVLVVFVYYALNKKNLTKKNKKLAFDYKLILGIFCLAFIHLHLISNYKQNFLKPDVRLSFLKSPIWKTDQYLKKAEKNLDTGKKMIPNKIEKSIKNSSKCLMVIPNFSSVPLFVHTCQVHNVYLQYFSNYPDNSDQLNIEKIKKQYPDNLNILFHNGSIDGRIYLSESPKLLLAILKNYKLELKENQYLLLTPKNKRWQDIECKKSSKENHNFVQIHLKESILEKIKKTIYKPTKTYIHLQINDKTQIKRTYRSQLEYGIITDPYFQDTQDIAEFLNNPKDYNKTIKDYSLKTKDRQKEFQITEKVYYRCD
ncbi:MAG: hypothetical protein GF335_00510 [Candidatus Moranbacteria bacterium]|nr:hypothetical protein [Candidatus Moranbacteria bacterium]